MTIIHLEEYQLPEDLISEPSLERRDSLKEAEEADRGYFTIGEILEVLDRIKDRGAVCRADVASLESFSAESSTIALHLNRYPSMLYTEALSDTLYNETVTSLESSVIKSMSDTLSSVTSFIGNHGGSAIRYIKEVFDEDAKTNANIRKTSILIDYITDVNKLLNTSTQSSKFKRDLDEIDKIIFDKYTSKWNGLKDAISRSDKDMAILSESIALPVIEAYPEVMNSIKSLIEEVSKSKDKKDIENILKKYKSPSVNLNSLNKWISKHVTSNKVDKTNGIVTEMQTLGMSIRTHVKSLENDRNSKVSFKVKDVIDIIQKTEWVTTSTVADDILKKAELISSNQEKLASDMNRLVQKTIIDNESTQLLIPIVLELLSIVRGFGALIDAIGILTVTKRVLVNDQLEALSEAVKAIHQIVKNKRGDMTVSEVMEFNKLTVTLKSNI